MGLVYHLLAGEGRGNLQTYCPQFHDTQICRRSHCLLIPIILRFKCSWLVTATDIWNGLPADILLQGETYGWHIILRDIQHFVCT